MTESRITVTVCMEKDGDGFYAYAPALEGLHVGGDTADEALENVKDGIILYLESLVRHGEPFPVGAHLKIENYNVHLTSELLTKEISVLWKSHMMPGDRSRASQQKDLYALLRKMVGFKKKEEEPLLVS